MGLKQKIQITSTLAIDPTDIKWEFIRASGPGGQNVNKVATAVQLRFDVRTFSALPEDARGRLAQLAGRRMTEDGVLILGAKRFRTQERNRQDAIQRLVKLIRKSLEKPKTRRKTRPSPASRQKRLDEKRHRSETKKSRQSIVDYKDHY